MQTQPQTPEMPYIYNLKGIEYKSILPPNERVVLFVETITKMVDVPATSDHDKAYKAGLNHVLNLCNIWFKAEIEANKQLTETTVK